MVSIAAALLLTASVSLMLPKKFKARASIVVNSMGADPVMLMQNPTIAASYISTQVEIIASPRVARKVVAILGLAPAGTTEHAGPDDGGTPNLDTLAETLSAGLEVKPASGNVIDIKYNSTDPSFAASAANAFARAYLETAVELRIAPARQNAQFFDSRAAELRARVEQAQAKLSEYQQKNGIIRTGVDNRLDIENAKLADLSAQLTLAQTHRFDTQSRQAHAAGDMASSPDVLQSPVVQQLRSQVAGEDAKLKQLSMQLGPNHPQYVRAASELAALNAKLRSEMAQVASSVLTADRVSAQKSAELNAAVEGQRRKILELSGQNDELAMLQREVGSAQAAYDLVIQRFSQTSLQSQSQQADVALLTSATAPAQPYSPRLLFNLIIGLVLGASLGLALALVGEMTRPLLRNADDVAAALGLPVLATIPAMAPRRRTLGAWLPFKRLATTHADA